MSLTKVERRQRIKLRIKKTVTGTASMPRLSVFRSNKEIYAQVIDDTKGITLAAASSKDKGHAGVTGTATEIAAEVGKAIGENALKAGNEKVAFDRGGYLYHGRVKSLADGARTAGLKF